MMVLIFIEVLLDVLSRFIFHFAIPWGAEVSQTLLVWMTFIGVATAYLKNEHVSVEIFADCLPKRAQAFMRRLNIIIIVVFLVCGTWSGALVVKKTWRSFTASLQIPSGVMYLALPIGFALTAVYAIWILFSNGKNQEGRSQ
jgi:TRAP-type C4-dicarboxylate transport system permease small subunit